MKKTFVILIACTLLFSIGLPVAANSSYEVQGSVVQFKDQQLTLQLYDGRQETYLIPTNIYVKDEYGTGLYAGAWVELEKDINGQLYKLEIKSTYKQGKTKKQGYSYKIKGLITKYSNNRLTIQYYGGQQEEFILPNNVPVQDKYAIGFAPGAKAELKLNQNDEIIVVEIEPITYEVKGYITSYSNNKLTIQSKYGGVETYTIPERVLIKDKANIGFTNGAKVELEIGQDNRIYEIEIEYGKR